MVSHPRAATIAALLVAPLATGVALAGRRAHHCARRASAANCCESEAAYLRKLEAVTLERDGTPPGGGSAAPAPSAGSAASKNMWMLV